jgi:DNA-binding IclR family transcriptional regulator
VPSAKNRSNLGIAIQGPTMRLTSDKALEMLPALRRAAESIAAIDAEATPGHTPA